jgi:hypothetical protein
VANDCANVTSVAALVAGAIAGEVVVDWDCPALVLFLEFGIWMAVPVSSSRPTAASIGRRM